MIDHRDRQRTSARREGRLLLAENITFEKFAEGAKNKRFPAGSIWCWAAMEVYGPIGSAKQEQAA